MLFPPPTEPADARCSSWGAAYPPDIARRKTRVDALMLRLSTSLLTPLFRRVPMAPRFTLAKDSEQFRSAPKDLPRALRYAASAACRPRELASAALCRVLRGIDEAP